MKNSAAIKKASIFAFFLRDDFMEIATLGTLPYVSFYITVLGLHDGSGVL